MFDRIFGCVNDSICDCGGSQTVGKGQKQLQRSARSNSTHMEIVASIEKEGAKKRDYNIFITATFCLWI